MRFLKSKTTIMSMLLGVIVCMGAISCNKDDDKGSGTNPTPTPNPSAYPKNVSIEYRASVASGSVAKATSITFTNETGGESTVNDVPMPFSKKIDRNVKYLDKAAIAIMQNNSATPGAFSIKLEILVDGQVVKTETHSDNSHLNAAIVHFFQ